MEIPSYQVFVSHKKFCGRSQTQKNAYDNMSSSSEARTLSGLSFSSRIQNSLTGSTEMAVAISLASCPSRACQPSSSIMGCIIYNGLFDPAYHETYLPPYQNFTVTVPSAFAAGQAQINVAHTTLIGVSRT